MAYVDNGINFGSFDSNSFQRGKKVSNEQYWHVNINELQTIATANGGSLPTIINGLEIDWNSAKLDKNITIKTTAQLLSLINKMLMNFKTDNNVDTLYFAKFQPDEPGSSEGTLIL